MTTPTAQQPDVRANPVYLPVIDAARMTLLKGYTVPDRIWNHPVHLIHPRASLISSRNVDAARRAASAKSEASSEA